MSKKTHKRLTNKDLEWGTIEKTLIFSLSESEVLSYTGYGHQLMNELNSHLRDSHYSISEFQKKLRAWDKTYSKYFQAISQSGTHLVTLNFFNFTPIVDRAFLKFGEMINSIAENRILTISLTEQRISTTDRILTEITRSRDDHKLWVTSLQQKNICHKKTEESVLNLNNERDPVKLIRTQYNTKLCEKKEANCFESACDKLVDINWYKDIVSLRFQVEFLLENNNNYTKAREFLVANPTLERDLLQEIQESKEQYASKRAKKLEAQQLALKKAEEEKYFPLVDLISQPDLNFMQSLLFSTPVDAQDQMLQALIKVLDAFGRNMPIIKQGITNEIASTQNVATLFRGNSCATKLMSGFTKMIGTEYLKIIKPILEDMNGVSFECKTGYSFEVNPAMAGPNDNIDDNMNNLLMFAKRLIDAIFNSLDQCPYPFREMANHLAKESGKKFNTQKSKMTAVAGFVFLRFFCPPLSSPDSFGLMVKKDIGAAARRGYVLVGKIIQNIANGVKFGQKESYMDKCNPFIEEHLPLCENFLETFAELPPNPKHVRLCTIDDARKDVLPYIHERTVALCEIIAKSLRSYKLDHMIEPFVTIIGNLGDIDVEILPAPEEIKKKTGLFG